METNLMVHAEREKGSLLSLCGAAGKFDWLANPEREAAKITCRKCLESLSVGNIGRAFREEVVAACRKYGVSFAAEDPFIALDVHPLTERDIEEFWEACGQIRFVPE